MAGIIPYETGDIVEMKKKHPCGSSEWEILKAGADIKMKCLGCGHRYSGIQRILCGYPSGAPGSR